MKKEKLKAKWSKKQFQAAIKSAQDDIDNINLLMNETFHKLSAITQERIHLRKAMSRKQLYINTLTETMKEL